MFNVQLVEYTDMELRHGADFSEPPSVTHFLQKVFRAARVYLITSIYSQNCMYKCHRERVGREEKEKGKKGKKGEAGMQTREMRG